MSFSPSTVEPRLGNFLRFYLVAFFTERSFAWPFIKPAIGSAVTLAIPTALTLLLGGTVLELAALTIVFATLVSAVARLARDYKIHKKVAVMIGDMEGLADILADAANDVPRTSDGQPVPPPPVG